MHAKNNLKNIAVIYCQNTSVVSGQVMQELSLGYDRKTEKN